MSFPHIISMKNIVKGKARIYIHENHDIAIARSSSSCADPRLKVAFKCLIHCHWPGCLAGGI